MKRKDILAISPITNIILSVILLLITIACLLPYILSVSITFSRPEDIAKYGVSLIPRNFTLETFNYVLVFKQQLIDAFKVSTFVTIVGAALTTILTTSFGYVLSRKDFPFNKQFTFFIFFTMLFNAGLIPNYMVVTQVLRLKNTIWALIIPMCINPFWMIVSRTFFKISIPFEMIEAAKIDGASEFKIFFRIIMPLSLPIFATIGLFSSIGYWNDWFSSLLYISNPRLVSLQYMLQKIQKNIAYLMQNSNNINPDLLAKMTAIPMESLMMAIMIIATLPIVIAYPFFQRYFITGLTMGGVKE